MNVAFTPPHRPMKNVATASQVSNTHCVAAPTMPAIPSQAAVNVAFTPPHRPVKNVATASQLSMTRKTTCARGNTALMTALIADGTMPAIHSHAAANVAFTPPHRPVKNAATASQLRMMR